MNLTNSQRLKKLIGNLVTNPDLIGPWIKTSMLYKGLPVDLNLPWWSYRAIDAVDKVASGRKIFEYGTGGSTIRYGSIAKSIVSVEDNFDWLNVIQDRLDKRNINATLLHHEFNFKDPVDFPSSDYIHSVDNIDWDLLIIDGQDWSFRQRIECFQHAEPQARPGSIIVVDDFWRYTELLTQNRAKEVKVYESVGPCRIGVTSTALFHY